MTWQGRFWEQVEIAMRKPRSLRFSLDNDEAKDCLDLCCTGIGTNDANGYFSIEKQRFSFRDDELVDPVETLGLLLGSSRHLTELRIVGAEVGYFSGGRGAPVGAFANLAMNSH